MAKTVKSCKICGYFKENATEANAGYCLALDDENPGEGFKIRVNEEKETAGTCGSYFRSVPGISLAEFLAWRGGIEVHKVQTRWTAIGLVIAAASLTVAIIQLIRLAVSD